MPVSSDREEYPMIINTEATARPAGCTGTISP